MMSVDIVAKPGFSAGSPKVLFEGKYQLAAASLPLYDVSPDGIGSLPPSREICHLPPGPG
jgi:hypothetical protein